MQKPDKNLIRKFYENKCTDEEYEFMIEYLKSLDEKELNEFMESHIEQLEKDKIQPDINFQPDFDKIRNKITVGNPQRMKFRRKPVYSIAASIAIFIIMSAYAIYLLGVFDAPEKITWNEKITKLGQKSILTLLDGTRITLNAGSKLMYPTKFGKEIREVRLEGEAYFEVTSNPQKPFIVKSGEVTTTVLGTKFNIKAYPGETDIKVALLEGKVKVSKKVKNDSEDIFLLPKQQLVYNRNTKKERISEFDPRKIIGWRNNVLVFENEKLSEILTTLERAFGIKLEIKDKKAAQKRISADFEDESFWAIIEVIKYLTGLKTESIIKNNELKKVIFYKRR